LAVLTTCISTIDQAKIAGVSSKLFKKTIKPIRMGAFAAALLLLTAYGAAIPSHSADKAAHALNFGFDGVLRISSPLMGDCFAFKSTISLSLDVHCTAGENCFRYICFSVDGAFESSGDAADLHCSVETSLELEGINPGTHTVQVAVLTKEVLARASSAREAFVVHASVTFDILPQSILPVDLTDSSRRTYNSIPPQAAQEVQRLVPLRVGLLTQGVSLGGQEVIIYNQALSLPSALLEVEVMIVHRGHSECVDGPLPQLMRAAGIAFQEQPLPLALADLTSGALWQAASVDQVPATLRPSLAPLLHWLGGCDVLNLPNSRDGWVEVYTFLARLAGVPVVVLELPNLDPPLSLPVDGMIGTVY
jgi:hypothetical protein